MVPRVAICYDFDGTLIRGNMQDYTIIPRLIGDKDQFWESVNQYSKKHDMDYVLAYMYRMMEAAEQRGAKLTRNITARPRSQTAILRRSGRLV